MEWTGWQLRYTAGAMDPAKANDGAKPPEAAVVMVDPGVIQGAVGIVNPLIDRALRDLYARGAFQAEPGETYAMPAMGAAAEAYVLFVGCPLEEPDLKRVRVAAGGAGKALAEMKLYACKWLVPSSLLRKLGAEAVSSAFAEGLLLGAYRRNTRSAEGRKLPQWDIAFALEREEDVSAWHQGFAQGIRTADAVCYARELTNLPGNLLTPAKLAEEAASLASHFGLGCKIYDEKEALDAGMGGLLAVGKGSVNPPRMIVLRYNGNPGSNRRLGLVGKGITFDTGGVNLKPGKGMEEFISDMGGAAAVLGVMRGLAELRLKVNVTAVIPAAENMPSGNAYKPGDVIVTASGLTVEVLNTDAEGRIVLADGLTTAIREGADRLIDAATLTGAVMHALGDVATGAMTNNEPFLQQVLRASEQAGEYIWPLPSYPEYGKMLKSSVADLKNAGGPWGGAILGGLFVGAFAQDLPWVHLDIGGTAWMWEDRDLEPKGGTGVLVRTLLKLLQEEAEWPS